METRSKRRKLMMVSSYVSPRVSDLPATFESPNDDTKRLILQFVGNKSYVTYAGINKQCKEIYVTTKGMTKETYLYGYAPLSRITKKLRRVGRFDCKLHEAVAKGVVCFNRLDVVYWALEKQNKHLAKAICDLAAREGRIDVLNEVFRNVGIVSDQLWNYILTDDHEDYQKSIFQDVDFIAVRCGRLNVLKWFEDKGKDINKQKCAQVAARYGHLHIIQWLREVKGLELYGYMYDEAIYGGGHLHVLKWLREKGCPWGEFTFPCAAIEGNLAILQWLHDEGCPWPNDDDDDYRVSEEDVTPEVIDWLRLNGYYVDRIM